ncbi:hypothetical protein [Salipiger bermudensis]|uniref:hypothetical protein n=1 Tax=Salipiger TaxID=263377 RepID=UPI001CD59160|nr:hypothetical protein [Salipiger bermudensis]MCA0960714.1 hypothetical protein [Salipiger bermudensis]
MDKLTPIFELREMLRKLERDVGLEDLSRTERDVLLAAHSLTSCVDDEISTEQIRKHSLLEPVAQATLYRAIRTLLGYGLLEQTGQSRGRNYVVRSDLVGKDLPPS